MILHKALKVFTMLVMVAGLFSGTASAATAVSPAQAQGGSPASMDPCFVTLAQQFGNRAPDTIDEARAACTPAPAAEMATGAIIPITGLSPVDMCQTTLQEKLGDRAPASIAEAVACNPVPPVFVP
jgi:hypothetical protein